MIDSRNIEILAGEITFIYSFSLSKLQKNIYVQGLNFNYSSLNIMVCPQTYLGILHELFFLRLVCVLLAARAELREGKDRRARESRLRPGSNAHHYTTNGSVHVPLKVDDAPRVCEI